MAILRIYPGKKPINSAVSYIENPQKTIEKAIAYAADGKKTAYDKRYISGLNCMPETAIEEMLSTKRQYNKVGGVIYFHAKQSFHPDEKVTAEEVHKIGIELAKRLWGDFQVVVTTHIDKAHLHNHFIINSVSFSDGHKFSNRKKDIYAARMENDRLCKANGLSTIQDKRYRGKSYKEYLAGKGGHKTLRDCIKEDIDIAVEASSSMAEFIEAMKELGYTIKNGKHMAVHPAGYINGSGNPGYIRLRSLNDVIYSEEGIRARLRDNYNARYFHPSYRKKRVYGDYRVQKKRRLPYYEALYYKYLYAMGKMPKKPRVSPARIRADAASLAELDKQLKLLRKLKVKDAAELEKVYTEKKAEYERLIAVRQQMRQSPKSEEEKEAMREKIIELRGEIKTIEKIEVKTQAMKITFSELRMQKQKGEQNVPRSTGSGYDNIDNRRRDGAGDQDKHNGNRNARKVDV